MKFLYITTALLLLVNTPVSAKDYYMGLNIGILSQSGDFSVVNDVIDPTVGIDEVREYMAPDDSGISTALYVGYKLATDLSLEVGIVSNEELSPSLRTLTNGDEVTEKSKASYYYAAFVGIWPIQNNWAATARLGFSIWNLDYSQTTVNSALPVTDPAYVIEDQPFSDSTSAMSIGVGASYGINENLEFKISLEHHMVDFAFTNLELDYDATSIMVGTAYHF